MARLFDLCTFGFTREVDVEVARIGRTACVERGEALDLLDGEVETVAREEAAVQHIGAIERLEIVEDGFVQEGVVRDAGILPVDGVLPAQAAAEGAQ